VDAVLAFRPPASGWASNYSGTWLDLTTLLLTLTRVDAGALRDAGARAQVAVGALVVQVRPEGNLTSLDGTSAPSSASTVVGAGSWGDVVCDAALSLYSRNALVVSFVPPSTTPGPAPDNYTLVLVPVQQGGPSHDPGPPNGTTQVVVRAGQSASSVQLPAAVPSATVALRFVLTDLQEGVEYLAQIAAAVPTLVPDVTAVLPHGVQPVFVTVGAAGGCSCETASTGVGCVTGPDAASPSPVPVAPQRPTIGSCNEACHPGPSRGNQGGGLCSLCSWPVLLWLMADFPFLTW
jgi:hypothetical protein